MNIKKLDFFLNDHEISANFLLNKHKFAYNKNKGLAQL